MTYPRYYNARIETMPPKQVQELQERKLRKQLVYTYQSSAFYRHKFDQAGLHPEDIRTLEDVAKLPFTTKEELRDSQIEHPPLGLHAAVPLSRVIRIHASSGTTGRPSYVGITKHDRDTWIESVARVYWAEGVRPDSVVVMGFGIGFFVGGLPLHNAIEEIGATFIPVGTGASYRLITSIQNLNANQLTCTPSSATYLAEYVRNKSSVEPQTRGIRRVHKRHGRARPPVRKADAGRGPVELHGPPGARRPHHGQWLLSSRELPVQHQERQPAEVVAVQVRDQHHVDRVRVHAEALDRDQRGGAAIEQGVDPVRLEVDAALKEAAAAEEAEVHGSLRSRRDARCVR